MDIQRLLASMQGRGGGGLVQDSPMPDTAEKIQISSLSLLKMLKHGIYYNIICIYFFILKCFYDYYWNILIGRAGVPMEVMGLMLGQFVDDYTITCVDVFAMPQVNIIDQNLQFII
jgi:26S proteasome regulatory subunit N11